MKKSVDDETEYSAWMEDMEDYEWVGIVYPQDARGNVTLITPLAFCDQNDIWQTITESDRNEYFPNNGKVACFTGDFPERKMNRLVWFWPELNQYLPSSGTISPADPRYSRFLTHSDLFLTSEKLAQVFNWTPRADNLFAAVDFLAQGIPAEDCLSRTIFIRYQDKIYGPVHLEPDYNNPQMLKPREYNQKSSPGGQPLLVNGFPFNADQMIMMVGQAFLDPKRLGSPRHQADWSQPQMTMKRVLRASKSVSAELQSKERLVEREINELAALSASNGPEALRIEECVIQRAQYIVSHQMKRLGSLQELIEELPEEHPLLVKARSIEVQQRKEKIDQESEAEQKHLQKLQGEVKVAQENLERLHSEIKVAEQEQKQVSIDLEALKASLPGRLAELREQVLNLFTELQITSVPPLIRAQIHNNGRGISTAEQLEVVSPVHRQSYFATEKVTSLINPQDFDWAEIARQNGANTRAVRTCVAALLAGFVPAVGNQSLWQAVAHGIAGQRIWRVPVPLTATEPLALFGHISAENQSFIPVAGELADILIEAQDHPDQLGLIVLEGIDRVPFLPVIEPLLRQYRAVRQHIQQVGDAFPCQETLQLFHPRALVPEDPYQQISRLAWPANLLLGVAFDANPGSFPLPGTHAPWFAFIERAEFEESIQGYWPGPRKNWQVPSASWYVWEKECFTRATRQNDLALSEDFDLWQRTFYAAMGHSGMKKNLHNIIEQLWP